MHYRRSTDSIRSPFFLETLPINSVGYRFSQAEITVTQHQDTRVIPENPNTFRRRDLAGLADEFSRGLISLHAFASLPPSVSKNVSKGVVTVLAQVMRV
jgi:hypothetical protein